MNLLDKLTNAEDAAIVGGSLQLRFFTIHIILNTAKVFVVIILSVVALAPPPTSVARHILAKAGHCVEFTVIAKRAGCGEIT